ncbi:T-Box Transcription Factor Tbx5 [Manis pentadactyla]|nr:T-Box Transcription Factor Tbx5 [Manis pentadactyla]
MRHSCQGTCWFSEHSPVSVAIQLSTCQYLLSAHLFSGLLSTKQCWEYQLRGHIGQPVPFCGSTQATSSLPEVHIGNRTVEVNWRSLWLRGHSPEPQKLSTVTPTPRKHSLGASQFLICRCQACWAAPSSPHTLGPPALLSLSCSSWCIQPSISNLLGLQNPEKALFQVLGFAGRGPSWGAVGTRAGFLFVLALAVRALSFLSGFFPLLPPNLSLP